METPGYKRRDAYSYARQKINIALWQSLFFYTFITKIKFFNMKMVKVFLTFVFGLVLLFGCKKKDDAIKGCTDSTATNYNNQATEDDGSCTYLYDATSQKSNANEASGNITTAVYEDLALYNYSQYEADNNSNLDKINGSTPTPSCATISVTPMIPSSWPKTLTIDFGSANCLCDDGKNRRGKIEVRINDSWITPNPLGAKDSMVITLNNYYVNDTLISGTRTFVKDTLSTSKIGVSIIVNNASATFSSTETVTWSYTGSLELLFGDKTDYTDNVVNLSISGTIEVGGKDYAISTSQTLSAQFNCLSTCVFTSGTLNLSNTETQQIKLGQQTYTTDVTTTTSLDFGTGTCDGSLSLTTGVVGITAQGNQIINESTTEAINCDDYLNWE